MSRGTLVGALLLMVSVAPPVAISAPERTDAGEHRSVEDGTALAAERPGPDRVLAIRDVRLFDGERVIPRTTVVVRGGTIEAVGPDAEVPAGAEVVSGEDRTLLPGFIDAHTHTPAREMAEAALVFGVTTVLDMLTPLDALVRYREEKDRSEAHDRAAVFSSGIAITAPGGHGTQFGVPIPTLGPQDDPDAFVAERVAEGSNYIKIIHEDGRAYPGLSFQTFSPATLEVLVRAAHARDRLAVAHVGYLEGAWDAVRAGVDGLVHAWLDAPADEALVEEMAGRGVFVAPTLTVLESMRGGSGSALLEDERLLPYLGPEERARLGRGFPPLPEERGSFSHALATVGSLAAAGVPILAGTDAPNPGTAHGASIHRELDLLEEAGLSPVEALRAATSVPADAFALDDRGRVAPGLRADLLLVEGDPTADLAASRAIVGVWKAGRPADREAFAARVRERLAAAAAPTDSPLPADGGPVSDFDGGRLEAAFGMWTETSDRVLGGSSTAVLEVVEGGALDTPFALRITGKIEPGPPFAFAGAMFFPGPQPMAAVDLSAAEGLRFHARGDAGRYRIFLFTRGAGDIPIEQTFQVDAEWREIALDWTDFGGSDGTDVRGIAIVGGPEPGPFELWIDQVEMR